MELGEPLFAFVALELGPELELLVYHFESLRVVPWQLDLFPELVGQMGPFDGFHVEIAHSFFLEDSRIAGIGEGATVP